MRICYHGTSEENVQPIFEQGFRPDTFFARHLEDALAFGGNHVFRVAFDNPPEHWQFIILEWVKPDKIVSYTTYSTERLFHNEELGRQVFESNIK